MALTRIIHTLSRLTIHLTSPHLIAAGYFSISEHDELKDCGQTMKLNNQDVDDVQIGSGEAAWIASTKEAWYLKSGDRYVVVPVGAVPWTADAGWNTAAKFTWVCYPQTEPYYCSSITQPRFNGDKSSTFKNLADGHYDIWFSKYLGTNEFGEDKGWSIEFKLNQQLTIGDSTAPAPAEDADDADDEAAAQAADGEAAAAQAADEQQQQHRQQTRKQQQHRQLKRKQQQQGSRGGSSSSTGSRR